MDTLLEGYFGNMNDFKLDHGSIPVYSNQNLVNRVENNHGIMGPPFLTTSPTPSNSSPSSGTSSEGDSPEEHDFSNAVLKYISEMLMEEDLEGKTCMLQDCMALQAAEKSFYDVLGENYPPLPNRSFPVIDQNEESLGDNFIHTCGEYGRDGTTSATDLVESNWISGLGESESSYLQTPFVENSLKSTTQPNLQSQYSPSSFSDIIDGLVDSPVSTLLVSDYCSANQPVWQIKRGAEDTSKFHPNVDSVHFPPEQRRKTPEVARKAETDQRNNSPNGPRGRKNHHREDDDHLEEGRSNKHSAVYTEVSEPLEMFDKVLLCNGGKDESTLGAAENGASTKLQQNEQSKGSNGRTTRGRKQGNKKEVVDLRGLLTLCAQAVASNDHRTSNELLKQIRQHSSPFGDGSQRLAHYFANALEARLAGTRTKLFVFDNRTPAVDILKAYQVYVSACPFKKMSNIFANGMIANIAEKATRLHIIDFGVLYGFQWPCLIQRLSVRSGGPPKLRITGIEFPQPGFRPAERVEETGHRLAKYCERFNVPFEYHAIAQKWETIQLEDLKIDRDEVLVVNCLYRLKNILDETVVVNSPRDSVLSLIRRINPDIFIHGAVNGTYNAPFFVTRFREALFHFSALFDMFEATIPREDQARLMYEKEMFGRDAMNIIASEGLERLDRPETYKQWQVRNIRAGFKQLPLNQDLLKKVRSKVKSGYHKDFVVDEDSQWMLQGWKGRIIHALSCWRPA